MSEESGQGTPRPGGMERFAIDCALQSAWKSHLGWHSLTSNTSYIDHFEASATSNLQLLEGLEDLGEDIARRGIIPSTEGGQAELVTDGGVDDGQGIHPSDEEPKLRYCDRCVGDTLHSWDDGLWRCDTCGGRKR